MAPIQRSRNVSAPGRGRRLKRVMGGIRLQLADSVRATPVCPHDVGENSRREEDRRGGSPLRRSAGLVGRQSHTSEWPGAELQEAVLANFTGAW